MNAQQKFITFSLLAVTIAGCGGRALSPGLSPSGLIQTAGAASTSSVKLSIRLSPPTTSSFKRRAQFVSPATNGIDLYVYTHPQSANATALAHVTADVSATSAACAADPGGTRTCTVAIPINAGTYDFAFSLYDAAPIAGSFSSAKLLGTGSVIDKTIALNADNEVAVDVEGQIANLSLEPARFTYQIGAPASFQIGMTPLDADKYVILAGNNEPYLNPITVTVADTGSHTLLSLNGGAPTASVTSTQLTDRITAAYDGKGSAGYYATVTASATGVATVSETLDSFAISTVETDFTNFGQTTTITVTEPHPVGTFALAPSQPVPCTGVATPGAFTSGAVETFTLTAGQANGTCELFIDNEDQTLQDRSFVQLYTPGPVPTNHLWVEGGVVGAYTAYDMGNNFKLDRVVDSDDYQNNTHIGEVTGIARDASGNVYIADPVYNQIEAFAPTANDDMRPIVQIVGSATGISSPRDLKIDSAGNIYVLNIGSNTVEVFGAGSNGNVAPIRTISLSALPFTGIRAMAIDSAANVYVAGYVVPNVNSVGYVVEFAAGASGTPTPIRMLSGSNTQIGEPDGLNVDSSGNIYVTSDTYDNFSEYAPNANGNATPTFYSNGQLNQPSDIAVRSDGTILTTGLTGSGEYVVTYPPGVQNATAQYLLIYADSSISRFSL